MRKTFYVAGAAILILISTLIYASSACNTISNAKNATGINFIEADWNKALAEAKKQNKPIFVDVYATWCGPCKQLKRITFKDSAAANFYNSHFINVSLDAEKGAGIEIAKRYQVSALPTLVIADTSGRAILYTQGFVDANDLIAFGKAAISKK